MSKSELISDFNSIKVRLKLGVAVFFLPLLAFQFHKGTIKTSSSHPPRTLAPHFNSIKVRLKLLRG